jgi:peptide-methionine (S)-S-oxide reductase
MSDGLQKATFGAGCFWGVESNFRQIPGVVDARVGYLGGTLDNPTYEDVCTDRTGHAEVVQVTYDPQKVAYEKLLDAFWTMHDPTQLNRQGPDYHTPEQEAIAKRSKEEAQRSGRFKRPIVTEITPASKFYEAEDYHQRYFEKRGIAPTCHI